MRRTTFRQEGRPHQLLVLADVSRPLRDEERQAWQRLIRVIGHEINNSLDPDQVDRRQPRVDAGAKRRQRRACQGNCRTT